LLALWQWRPEDWGGLIAIGIDCYHCFHEEFSRAVVGSNGSKNWKQALGFVAAIAATVDYVVAGTQY
jgi:hypothetical protein